MLTIGAGIQPFAYTWVACVLIGVLAYVLKADSPALGELAWADVAKVVTGWWLTAFGGSLHLDGTTVSLPPLGLTLITSGILLGFVRRVPILDWIDVLIFSLSAGLSVFLIGQLAPLGSVAWSAGLGAVIMALLATCISKNRPDWFGSGPFTKPAGRLAYDGFILATKAFGIFLIASFLLLLVAVVLNFSDIRSIQDYYVLDIWSLILMWVFQLLYLPTFVPWAGGFMTGAGFAVGAGSNFSAFGVTSAPLPAIPFFGALPDPGSSFWWLIFIPIIAAGAVGVRAARSFPTLSEAASTGGVQVLMTGLLGVGAALMASGAIGPERMSITGSSLLAAGLASGATIGLPLLAGLLAGHHTSVARYRGWMGKAKDASHQARLKHAEKKAAAASSEAESASPIEPSGADEIIETDESQAADVGKENIDDVEVVDDGLDEPGSETDDVSWDDLAPTAPDADDVVTAVSPTSAPSPEETR